MIDFVFVCDQDDEAVASPLLTATMPLEPGIEEPGVTHSRRPNRPLLESGA